MNGHPLFSLKENHLLWFKKDIMRLAIVIKDLKWPRLIHVTAHVDYRSHLSCSWNLNIRANFTLHANTEYPYCLHVHEDGFPSSSVWSHKLHLGSVADSPTFQELAGHLLTRLYLSHVRRDQGLKCIKSKDKKTFFNTKRHFLIRCNTCDQGISRGGTWLHLWWKCTLKGTNTIRTFLEVKFENSLSWEFKGGTRKVKDVKNYFRRSFVITFCSRP